MALRPLGLQAGGSMLKAALAALVSIALAGCELVPRRAEGPPPAPEAQQAERPVNEDAAGPALPAGETRNRVAVLVPLTGSNAAVGQSIANAANLALLDTGGEKIRITAYDTAQGALAAVNEALADGSGLFLGPLLAEDARAIAPIARRADVPVIAFSNDVSIAGDGVNVLGLNPGQSIARVVDYAGERGMRRFAALLPASIYGERAGRALNDAVAQAGGTLVAAETYNRTPDTLREAAARLAARGEFDAVLIADGPRMAALAVPALRRASPDVRVLGTELWASDAGLSAQAALRGGWFAAPSAAMFDQFRRRYRARFNADPSRLATLGYDAVLLALRVGEDWRLGRHFPARALRSEDGFAGVDGAFRFGRDNIAERALEVLEVTTAGTTTLSPAPRGFD